MIRQA